MSSLRVRSVTVGLATGLDSQNNLIIRQPSISNSVVSFSRFDSSGNVVADVVSFNTLTGSVTFENPIIASITGNAATVTDGVYTSRSINTNNGLSGGGNLSADRTLGLTGQALALHNLSTNGVITRTGSGTVAARTITGTTNQVIVTNGDGVSGNPTLSLPQNIHTAASPTFAGATLNGNLGIRASSTSSVATQIPVFIADPASTTRTISTRTPAQLRSDIGVNDGTLTMNVSGTGLTGSQTFTANQSSAATFTVTSNATSANTVNTIVARNASGNFSAGSITASALNGLGVSSGTNTFTLSRGTSTLVRSGAHALTLTTTAASNVTLPTSGTLATTAELPTVNDGTLTMSVSGTGLTGSQTFTANQSSAATFTVTSNATSANTVNTIVARNASGNFSAGTITATFSGSLSGNATTATTLQTARTINGVSFNGSANITLPTVNTSGNQTISGTKTFSTGVSISGTGGLAMNNRNITGVNHITINDPGANEGIEWLGGSNWKIYESPNNLTNASGNLQFVTGSTRRMTLNTSGQLEALGGFSGALSGNATTATTLQTARTINGVSFNGSANITLATVNTTGNQSIGGIKTFSGTLIIPTK
jgi:hypothetical protein